ncbi:MAG: two-component regulator propeller domain-containing protein [Arenimonas sp.]
MPETPQFRLVTVADGLPSSTLYAITQDKKGYLWIASKDGLARYDGVGYKTYRHAPGDENSLPGNVVQALHVDSRDQLWIAVEGQGVSRLNAERTELTHYRKSTHPQMGSDDIWAMTSTSDGSLWLGTYGGGLHRMDASGTIKRFMPNKNDVNSLPSDTIVSLAVDTQDRLWIGTTKGLCVWNGKSFSRIKTVDPVSNFIMQLISDKDGSVWVGTRNGLLHLSADGYQVGNTLLSGNIISGLWQDKHGAIWFSNRTLVFQWQNRQLLSYVPDTQIPARIYGVFEDHEGGFWFPTEDRGLLRLPAGWRNFSVFKHDNENIRSLSNAIVFSASEAGTDHAWLVTKTGLDKINLSSGDIERVLTDTQNWTTQLWSTLQAHDGSIWLGHSKGVVRINTNAKAASHLISDGNAAKTLPGGVRLLIQTKDRLLWSASYGGGIQAHDEAGHLVHKIAAGDGKGLLSADPDQFAIHPNGELWVATAEGLLRWNGNTEKFIAIEGSPTERVDAFSFLARDIVWVHRIGVLEAFKWDGKKLNSIRRVTGDDGLPPVEVGSMLPDRSDNLWLTTTRGLLRYNTATNELRMFGERDGLPSQEFDMQPGLLTSSGLMLVGTTKGLVIFDPEKIKDQSALSQLVVEGISVRRGDDRIDFPSSNDVVNLKADDRDLTVSLRLLSYADAQAHRYRFLMKSYDNDWVDVGAQGERVFSSLPPGHYELQAKAADAGGRWSVPLKLRLFVQPPWWKTGWATGLWLLILSFLVLASAHIYRARLKSRHEQRLRDQEREIAQQNSSAKSRFLATLGHEIRTPMTGVLGMAELLQTSELDLQQRHRVDAIQIAGRHLLRLVNDVLDLAQIEAGKLRLNDEVFDVARLVFEVSELLKPLAEFKGLSFSCIIDENVPDFCAGDEGRVRQILLNLGNNAIKFTEQGRVIIHCAVFLPEGLLLQVSDTGPGMSAEQQARLFQRFEQAEGNRTNRRYGGSGLGLAICQELADAMNGKILVNSELGQGATFTAELPLKTAQAPVEIDVRPSEVIIADSPLNILLVEDEPLVAEVISELLKVLGHTIVSAPQGLQALSLLSVQTFDVALIDLDLPGIDGLELSRLILTQGYSMPLVAITARADTQAEIDAISAGMKGFIRKPVDAASLSELLKSLVITDHSE